MAKNKPSNAVIAVRTAGGPHFDANFQTHMMLGNHVGGVGAHTGLHSLNVAAGQYPNLAELARIDTDARVAGIYVASVRLNGAKAPKTSSFFPAGMTYAQILAAVIDAWRDSKIYAPQSEIYGQIAASGGLAWAGLTTIGGTRIWVGADRSGMAGNPIETAFPAVNNKFQ